MEKIKPVFVEIPSWYIKDKPVNHKLELIASMQKPISIDGLLVPPPAIGFFSTLELFESPFFLNAYECDVLDAAIALCICVEKDKAFQDALDYAAGHKTGLNKRASKYVKYISKNYKLLIEWLLAIPFVGFEMIHSNKKGQADEFLFGADTLATITGQYPGVSQHDIIWNISLCSVGFLFCAKMKEQGNDKNVYRPKDIEHIRELKPVAIANEKAGLLHEWQKLRPDMYSPSKLQVEMRPEIVAEHKELLNNFNKETK